MAMIDWDKLEEKVDNWHKLFDKTAELIGNDTITFDKCIACYHRYAPYAFELNRCKQIKVDDSLIKGDIILTLMNNLGEEHKVVVSRAFEAKAFGDIANIEIVLIKIKDYLNKNNNKTLESFASEAL
jgi:hypothetical protein